MNKDNDDNNENESDVDCDNHDEEDMTKSLKSTCKNSFKTVRALPSAPQFNPSVTLILSNSLPVR